MRNALNQINAVRSKPDAKEQIDGLPKWNDDCDFPALTHPAYVPGRNPVVVLERQGVFIFHPVDLDRMTLAAYPDAYGVGP